MKAHDTFDLYVNQAAREAGVLAIDPIRGKALCEYEMPAGRTFLTILDLDINMEPIPTNNDIPDDYQRTTVSYRACPDRWLRLMVEQGTEWYGGYTSGDSKHELELCKGQVARFRAYRDSISA